MVSYYILLLLYECVVITASNAVIRTCSMHGRVLLDNILFRHRTYKRTILQCTLYYNTTMMIILWCTRISYIIYEGNLDRYVMLYNNRADRLEGIGGDDFLSLSNTCVTRAGATFCEVLGKTYLTYLTNKEITIVIYSLYPHRPMRN